MKPSVAKKFGNLQYTGEENLLDFVGAVGAPFIKEDYVVLSEIVGDKHYFLCFKDGQAINIVFENHELLTEISTSPNISKFDCYANFKNRNVSVSEYYKKPNTIVLKVETSTPKILKTMCDRAIALVELSERLNTK